MNSNTQPIQQQLKRRVPTLQRVAAYSNLYEAARATTGNVASSTEQQYSQAELDMSDRKSVAKAFRHELRSSRSDIEDLSMDAHTLGSYAHQTAKHTKEQTPAKINASTEQQYVGNNMPTPETLCKEEFDSSAHQHSHVNNVVSSNTQAQALQDMYNAIANGVYAGIMAALSHNTDGQFKQCIQTAQMQYGSGANYTQNTVNDGHAADSSGSGRGRTGSVVYVDDARQFEAQSQSNGLAVGSLQRCGGVRHYDSHLQSNGLAVGGPQARGGTQHYDAWHYDTQPRSNDLAISNLQKCGSARHYDAQPRNNGLAAGGLQTRGGKRHDKTHSQSNGLAVGGSKTCGGAQHGDARHYDAQPQGNSPVVGGLQTRGSAGQSGRLRAGGAGLSSMNASKHKARAATQRTGTTPIRSNWYYKEEALSDADLKDQEFESSDEEDFNSKERGYIGDMVAQQKLIQQQQRTIYDVTMRCKMLTTAMASKTGDPHTTILDDFGRSCAANRRANRELDRLRSEVAGLRDKCARLEEANTNQLETSTATVLCMDAETNTLPVPSTSHAHTESATSGKTVAQYIKINKKLKHKLIKIYKKTRDYRDQRDVLKLALVRNLTIRPALESGLDF